MNTRRFLRSVAVLVLALPSAWAAAQGFPNKAVTIVVPFPAGGALDTVARGLAEQMRTDLGQPVIIDNRAGAGGTVGSAAVARAAPDGYTILLGSVATHAIAAGLYPKLPYDPIGDFAPITQLTGSPLVLAASPQFAAANVAELVAAAKAQPGKINYASTGNGTAVHIAGEAFRKAAGIDVLHVPYKGGPQATTAVLSGESSYMIANPQLVMSFVQAGRLRALAVTGSSRVEALPGVPTLKEAGVPGVEVTTWFGLWAPKGTPQPVIDRLNAAARKALASAEVKRQLEAQGDAPVGSSAADFAAFVRAEHKYWVGFVQSAGIKVD
jgi:tripartite-type tricarboxylate transporter receptor subunit TctC